MWYLPLQRLLGGHERNGLILGGQSASQGVAEEVGCGREDRQVWLTWDKSMSQENRLGRQTASPLCFY